MNNIIQFKPKGPEEGGKGSWEEENPFRKYRNFELNVGLAVLFGVKEALIISQIHHLSSLKGIELREDPPNDKSFWIKLGHKDIAAELGNLWSFRLMGNALLKLENLGILSSKTKEGSADKTKYYRINHYHLNCFCLYFEQKLRGDR